MLAIGSYNGTIGLFDVQRQPTCAALLNSHFGGVTQLKFSANGMYLFSGARKDGGFFEFML